MKKEYTAPEVDITLLDTEQILTDSGQETDTGDEDPLG